MHLFSKFGFWSRGNLVHIFPVKGQDGREGQSQDWTSAFEEFSFCQRWLALKVQHGCSVFLSSGETMVKVFLGCCGTPPKIELQKNKSSSKFNPAFWGENMDTLETLPFEPFVPTVPTSWDPIPIEVGFWENKLGFEKIGTQGMP